LMLYNWQEDRWARASQNHQGIISPRHKITAGEAPQAVRAWQSSRTLGAFSGTAGTAVFETGEAEVNPGGWARLNAVRPLVDQSALTVQIGTRSSPTAAVTWSAATTVNSRSGEANFREEARYHRSRLTVTGTFNSAKGLQYEAFSSGEL
jgi:hypothetical protein